MIQITWGQFLSFLLLITAIYYGFILLLFYRSELTRLFSGKPGLASNGMNEAKAASAPQTKNLTKEEEFYESANQLVAELKPVFDNGYVKEELMQAIQVKLRDYDFLKNTAFQISITNFIETEAKNKCSIHLSEEDLRVLWIR